MNKIEKTNRDEYFKKAIRLLRDLAELQNGTPLIKYEKVYNETMAEIWNFLEKHE